MRLLPALAEGHLEEFGTAIEAIQAHIGDHFAPAQGGRFASLQVAEALEWLRAQGGVGIGQSSWGPTGYIWFQGRRQAEALARQAQGRFGERGNLRILAASPRNYGARIESDTSHELLGQPNEGSA